MSNVRFKADLSSGLIELEGTETFVSQYLEKLIPLIEKAGIIRANPLPSNSGESGNTPGSLAGDEEESANNSSKKKRKVPKRPPAGASCRDRIQVLRNDGFFKEQKSPSDIVAGLAKKGWTYQGNQVSAALVNMFSSGEIQRTKATEGRGFVYFWDRK